MPAVLIAAVVVGLVLACVPRALLGPGPSDLCPVTLDLKVSEPSSVKKSVLCSSLHGSSFSFLLRRISPFLPAAAIFLHRPIFSYFSSPLFS
jgi:hypothetical protein